ncbi:MAG: HAMP domain-containing histidine kinase, partial [Anaerolineae bacterium]|nr:HAMP domain-containing histidine kinase [Anaerolineae bacterium]
TADDQDFLEILASQAAVAIENASLVSRLRAAYQELSQLDKMKNDFIAIASHELRTPLSVILGYASFLKEEAQGTAGEHATAVLNSALKMRQLIEDMTNLRYLKIGEAELQMEETSLAEVIEMATSDIQSTAEVHENRLQVGLPPANLLLRLDRAKMMMALTNILNNAVKFTSKNAVIRLTTQQHPDEVWIIVEDEGIGIPQDQLERIFEEFYQVADHMTRKHNGMGLGLSIARAVVRAHRGASGLPARAKTRERRFTSACRCPASEPWAGRSPGGSSATCFPAPGVCSHYWPGSAGPATLRATPAGLFRPWQNAPHGAKNPVDLRS